MKRMFNQLECSFKEHEGLWFELGMLACSVAWFAGHMLAKAHGA